LPAGTLDSGERHLVILAANEYPEIHDLLHEWRWLSKHVDPTGDQ
jgi:hypothetical protein